MALTIQSALRKDRRNAAGDMDGMQHRHFAVIAGIIAAMPAHAESLRTAKRSTSLLFADKLSGSNCRFDRRRFLLACNEPE